MPFQFNNKSNRFNVTLDDVLANYVPEPNSGCWLWLGPIKDGYGEAKFYGSVQKAHRVFYRYHKKVAIDGLVVHHLCLTPMCVNPDHLQLLTISEHMKLHPTPPVRKRLEQEKELVAGAKLRSNEARLGKGR